MPNSTMSVLAPIRTRRSPFLHEDVDETVGIDEPCRAQACHLRDPTGEKLHAAPFKRGPRRLDVVTHESDVAVTDIGELALQTIACGRARVLDDFDHPIAVSPLEANDRSFDLDGRREQLAHVGFDL